MTTVNLTDTVGVMSILRNRLLRRFSMIGRVADLAFVGGMALRVARRQGWIDSAQIDQFGEDPDVSGHRARLVEVVLTGAALGRLIRRKKR